MRSHLSLFSSQIKQTFLIIFDTGLVYCSPHLQAVCTNNRVSQPGHGWCWSRAVDNTEHIHVDGWILYSTVQEDASDIEAEV